MPTKTKPTRRPPGKTGDRGPAKFILIRGSEAVSVARVIRNARGGSLVGAVENLLCAVGKDITRAGGAITNTRRIIQEVREH